MKKLVAILVFAFVLPLVWSPDASAACKGKRGVHRHHRGERVHHLHRR